MTGLELHGLAWEAGCIYRLDTAVLRVARRDVRVIIAKPGPADALAEVLLGLASPLQGSVIAGGRLVTNDPAGRRMIGLIPVGGGLLPHLTVERNVAFGLGGMAAHRSHPGRVREVLSRLQLESIRRLRPHEISPVQRLRVAVARALCSLPEPAAVVVEDRGGQIPSRAAVNTAVGQDVAVLVIADAPGRAFGRDFGICHAVLPVDTETAGSQPGTFGDRPETRRGRS